jgi:hypothetical protein
MSQRRATRRTNRAMKMRTASQRLAALAAPILLAASAAPAEAAEKIFHTPSRNTYCSASRAGGDKLYCEVTVASHVLAAIKRPKDCALDYGDAFSLGQTGHAERACHGQSGPWDWSGATVLPYGGSLRFGEIVCTSRPTGLRCVNGQGHGFDLSTRRQRLF